MARCEWTDLCSFFTDEVGFSIDLQARMRLSYCLGDNSRCARLAALDLLPLPQIPDDLIPTDHERLTALVEAFEREVFEKYRAEHPDET